MSAATATAADRHMYVHLAGESHTLRLSLRHDATGRPTWIALARGFGTHDAWSPAFNSGDVFCIPAKVVPDVVAALTELAE